MDNSHHAAYGKIGFTVVLGAVAIVSTLIYLGGVRGRGNEVCVETYYDKPVAGLSVGSPVNFRGVKVGEVREISFVGLKYDNVSEADQSRIYLLLSINARMLGSEDVDVRKFAAMVNRLRASGLRATVTSSGITGLSRVEINMHAPNDQDPVQKVTWQPRHPYIPPHISLLENFSVAATKVMNQINSIDISSVWSNVNTTVQSLAQITSTANVMMSSRQDDIEKIVGNLSETTSLLRDMALQLRDNPSLLLRERVPTHLSETSN